MKHSLIFGALLGALVIAVIAFALPISGQAASKEYRTMTNEPSADLSATLEGSSWVLSTIDGTPVISGSSATITFADGKVSGSTGCNRYFGSYQITDETIRFSALGSTRMACTPALMTQEQHVLQGLQGAQQVIITGTQLLLQGDITLEFIAA